MYRHMIDYDMIAQVLREKLDLYRIADASGHMVGTHSATSALEETAYALAREFAAHDLTFDFPRFVTAATGSLH